MRKRTETRLRFHGWKPGRQVSIDGFEVALQEQGWPVLPCALRFLQEFGGLIVPRRPNLFGLEFGKPYSDVCFGRVDFDLKPGPDDLASARALMSLTEILPPCTPIGWLDVLHSQFSPDLLFLVSSTGDVFGWDPIGYDGNSVRIWVEGNSLEQFLDHVCGTWHRRVMLRI